MPALSQALRLLLLQEPGQDEAVGGIVANPALHAEVKAALPAIIAARDEAIRPAGEETVFAIVGRRLSTYPQPDRSEAEWAAWWADWYDALADLPASQIEAAMRQWVRSPEAFLPKPGQLRDLAIKQPVPEVAAAYRAQVAAAKDPPRFRPDAATRAAQAAELVAILSKPKTVEG